MARIDIGPIEGLRIELVSDRRTKAPPREEDRLDERLNQKLGSLAVVLTSRRGVIVRPLSLAVRTIGLAAVAAGRLIRARHL